MARVKVHTILGLKQIIGKREVDIEIPEASTVEALLSGMVRTWGEELGSYLFVTGSNRIHSHIRLMVNGQDIGFLNGLETVLKDGDEILILPPVAGG
ncbi:MAG: MoaD/ThiS family protein [Pseudomonadota bacterium]